MLAFVMVLSVVKETLFLDIVRIILLNRFKCGSINFHKERKLSISSLKPLRQKANRQHCTTHLSKERNCWHIHPGVVKEKSCNLLE